MPIPDTVLNKMICCLSDDGHIVHEPIVLKCGANACKKCVTNSTVATIQCFGCNCTHEKKDLINAPNNKIFESLIHTFLDDLFEDLNSKLKSTNELLKGFNFNFFYL